MTEAMPFLQKAILLSYAPRPFGRGIFFTVILFADTGCGNWKIRYTEGERIRGARFGAHGSERSKRMKRRFLALVLAGCLAAVLSTAAWAMSPTGFYLNVELPSGETIALDAESGDSIDNVKQKVQNAAGVSVTEQYLYYGGKFLNNGRTLADYNIQKESTLLVASEAKGTPSGTPLTAAEPSKEWVNITEEKVLTEGTYFLCNNVNLTHPLVIQGDVTLDLNGFVLKITGSGSVIKIESGTLTLVDSNPSAEHKFTNDGNDKPWRLDETAGAEKVKGGVITGGTGSTYKYNNDIGQIVYNDCGGGVFVAPGASFIMEGGNIVGCSAGKSGGGVKVTNDGDFKMSGGTISGCTAGGGGGIDNRGTTTLSDNAKIKSCSATGTGRDDHGGGVCSYRNLTVSGSMVISGCTAQNKKSYAMYVTTGYPDARSSIEGGTFDGSVWLDHSSSGKITVSGGTFKNGASGVWTVTFNTNGGTPEPESQIRANLPATKPDDPTRSGYVFAGWYTDEACTAAYDFTKPVTDSVTLYAKWEAAPRYYYNSGTTTDTDNADEDKKGSPKTFDPGVGIYAVSVALSLTGTAWIGRKRH